MMRRRYSKPVDVGGLLAKLASGKRTWMGIELEHAPRSASHSERWMVPGERTIYGTRHEAVREWLRQNPRSYGPYTLEHRRTFYRNKTYGGGLRTTEWILARGEQKLGAWGRRPPRATIAEFIRNDRRRRQEIAKTSQLGWRTFHWSFSHMRLKSPAQGTIWDGPELVVQEGHWSTDEAIRGHSGIHACRLPIEADWKEALRPHDMPWGPLVALCERFGKYVLGEVGWRAEWVIIREILCPTAEVARVVQMIYPEVKVHVAPEGHWCANKGRD